MSEVVKVSTEAEPQPSIWKNKSFLFLWTGSSINNLTFQVFVLAIPIIIYELTQSTFAMSAMRAIQFIPNILLGIIIGVIVDRLNRKRLMMGALSVQILMIASIVVLLMSDQLVVWHLYMLGFVLYSSSYAFGNAYHTILPLIMPKGQLTTANSALTFMSTFISIIGPAFAGFILLYMNHSFGLNITLAGMLVLLLLTSLVKIPHEERETRHFNKEGIWLDIKEGWYQLVGTAELWIATLMVLVSNFASSLAGAVLIFYALDSFKINSGELGFIFSASAVGGIIASFIAKKSRDWAPRGKLFVWTFYFAFFGQLIMFLSMNWYWLAFGMFLLGFQTTFFNIHYLTFRQESTPNHLLGRVAGTSSMIMKSAAPLGFLIAGVFGEFIEVHYIFLASAIIYVMILVFAMRSPIYRIG
ncbi:MFS transporter [Aquisalibacillus elongatus]|uniref:MFS transporter n=1 Tax=Aquisalibacillus elongatus TaxID=485577 RepID=A0A3N5B6X7_9BACI|nr:MFS transporter [Aquisalibacillus elongatus]RPF53446.1 MFS transporter [Aquisalibacillus elongatus]